ncbi:hypothetical protein M9H77_30326 [Catharanthus roseus]|uniref:Uncharacterized protein n=1 Tax=Catharanthus roseus TaxID=4058 RepID=A0ACB9ZX98_CATRO|nr:hypothetical protein M9H77_30326 [Catharanthus roseus]
MDNTPSRLDNIPRTYSTRSEHSFISPLIEEKDYVPCRVSTSQVSERDESNHHVEKVLKKDNIVKERDYKLLNGNIIKGILPPQQPFYLEKENNTVNFTAFSKIFENDTLNILLQKLDKSSIDSSGKKALIVKPPLQPPPEIKDYKLKSMSDLEIMLDQKF